MNTIVLYALKFTFTYMTLQMNEEIFPIDFDEISYFEWMRTNMTKKMSTE